MKLPRLTALALSLGFACFTSQASFFDQFIDPIDGKVDASRWLVDNAVGFLPMPILITDPSVGYGAGVVAAFFHENKDEDQSVIDDPNAPLSLPPSMSGVMALGTENGTRGAGAFHLGVWKQDRIRYTGAIAYFDANISSFHLNSPVLGEIPIGVNIKGTYFLQQLRFRVADSPWFLGLRYNYFDSTSSFSIDPIPDSLIPQLKLKDGAVSALVNYDTRDNLFSPRKGFYTHLNLSFHEPAFGSSNTYQTGEFSAIGYQQLSQKWSGGLRFKAGATSGDAPYYSYPFINMRGIPAMRYQGERVATVDGEIRYDFTPRWTAVAFAGVGQAFSADQSLGDTPNRYAKGIGFRYMIARRFNFRTGIDIARGPEDTTIHIVMGSGWADI